MVRTPVAMGAYDLESDSGADLGTDTGSELGTDTGADLGTDTGHDSGVDLGVDSGTDLGVDSGHDSGYDSGVKTDTAKPDTACPNPDDWTLCGTCCYPFACRAGGTCG